MRTSDFNYDLPESFIAQTPVEPRDSSRLMVLNRLTGQLEHRIFREIGDYLNPGDLLIVNQPRVIPARLKAWKAIGGKAEVLPVLAAYPQFQFLRFETGHDLEIERGPESPFWRSALEFLENVRGGLS